MVTVHVRLNSFFPRLDPDQGVYDIQVASGTTISHVIDLITTRHTPQLKKALLDSNGSLNAEIAIIFDHRLIPANSIDAVKVENDCQIKILPFVSGG